MSVVCCSYFAALAHRSYKERMLQRDVEASTGDTDIWTEAETQQQQQLGSTLNQLQCAYDQ